MHEWAIAEAIVKELENLLSKNRGIRRIKIMTGELQNIDEHILSQYIEMMMGEVAPNVEYSIEMEKAIFKCNLCGYTWRLKDIELSDEVREAVHFVPEAIHAYIKCPRCSSTDFDVIAGRGVKLVYEVDGE